MYLDQYGVKFTFIRDKSGQIITIPDQQMDSFIQMMEVMKEKVSLNEETFLPSDRVRVITGPLAGLEGELIKRDGRHFFLIRVSNITMASVKVAKREVEKIVG